MYLYLPFSVCLPCGGGCTPLDVDPRAYTRPFPWVGFVQVAVRRRTWIHVPLSALFGVLALFTWLYVSGRGSSCPYGPFSVCWPCAHGCTPVDVDPRACTILIRWVGPVLRGCTPLDVDPRTCTGPFRYVCVLHVAVRLRTLIHVPVRALFGVLALFTWLYSSRRGSTCL